jgi:hypothetical protein
MSTVTLLGVTDPEVATKRGQHSRALESAACAVPTNDRAERG